MMAMPMYLFLAIFASQPIVSDFTEDFYFHQTETNQYAQNVDAISKAGITCNVKTTISAESEKGVKLLQNLCTKHISHFIIGKPKQSFGFCFEI